MVKKKRSRDQGGAGEAHPSTPSGATPQPVLNVGNYVRVRPGVRDPDFPDRNISGWTGRITDVLKPKGAETLINVSWDRATRLAIPIETKRLCDDKGIVYDEIVLQAQELEAIDPPPHAGPGSLDDLLDDLESEGFWPPPDLVEKILAIGAAAIEPLREIVRRACIDPDGTACADIAASILGDLRSHEAVPDLLRLLREGPHDAMDWLTDALVALADAPLLRDLEAMIRDQGLDPLRRGLAIDIYERIAQLQPDARAALVQLLTALLTDLTARMGKLTAPEHDLAGNVALTLSQMGVTEARLLIDDALKNKVVPPWLASKADIEENYQSASSQKPAPQRTFLEVYRESYEEEDDGDGEDDEDDEERDPDDRGWDDDDEDEEIEVDEPPPSFYQPPAPVVRPKVGRNDPCPCGSGKKYKKCCLNKETAASASSPTAAAPSRSPERPFTVDTMKEALARELMARAAGATDSRATAESETTDTSTPQGLSVAPGQADEVPTIDYYEGHSLDTPGGREGLVEALVHDLQEGYFHTWHAVVCQERGLKLTKDQKRRLDDLIDFNDDPSERILYIDEIPRPRQAWYEIVRELASRLLMEPLDASEGLYRTMTEGWSDIVNALEEHGRGLPLPEGVERPVNVVPADLQHKLWIQWCVEPVAGLGYHDQTLQNEKEHWRVEDLVDRLRECKDSVMASGLTADTLLARVVMPESERELVAKLLTEVLKLSSMSEPLVGRL